MASFSEHDNKVIFYIKKANFPPQNKLYRGKNILQCGVNLIKI